MFPPGKPRASSRSCVVLVSMQGRPSTTTAQKLATERALAVAVALRKLGVNVWMNYNGAGPFNNKTSSPEHRKVIISWVPIVG